MIKKFATAAALALAASSAAHAQDAMPEVINFGIISTESASVLEANFKPFLDDMAAALGAEVKPFFASDYAGVIAGMGAKQVDVAWFGNASAIQAVDLAGGEVFAQTVKDNGDRGYYSLLITQKDSPLNSIEDVLKCDKSLTFGTGDPNSTSGSVIPGYYAWALNGVTPEECFAKVAASNHEGNALAVAAGQVDLATNNTESIYARLAKSNPEAAAQIKEIWRSPLIPSDPMVWRADLPQMAKEKIYYFFMQYGRFGDMEKVSRERAVLSNLSDGWGPFLASSNAQLIEVRKINAFKAKVKAEAAGDAEGVAAADALLAELNAQSAAVGEGGY